MESSGLPLDLLNADITEVDTEYPSTSSTCSSEFSSVSPVAVSTSGTSANSSNESENDFKNRCGLCHDLFENLKVLPCLHTFCQTCLVTNQNRPDKLSCPCCHQECTLPSRGIGGLLPNVAVTKYLEENKISCTSCRSKTSQVFKAVASCYDCNHFLCTNCVMAHQFMHCFEGHRVLRLPGIGLNEDGNCLSIADKNTFNCPGHKTEVMEYFCFTCNIPICSECIFNDHNSSFHEFDHFNDIDAKKIEVLNKAVEDSKTRVAGMLEILKHSSGKLQTQYHRAESEINETFQFYKTMLEEQKQELLKELESTFSANQISLDLLSQKAQDNADQIYQACSFYEQLSKQGGSVECLMFKKLIDSRLQNLLTFNNDADPQNACNLEFVSNYKAIQAGIKNTFGYVRSNIVINSGSSKQPPIARPTKNQITTEDRGIPINKITASFPTYSSNPFSFPALNEAVSDSCTGCLSPNKAPSFDPNNAVPKLCHNTSSLFPFSASVADPCLNSGFHKIWSNGGSAIPQFELEEIYPPFFSHEESSCKLLKTPNHPQRSQLNRQKMIYHYKFGDFGALEGQFTEPSGVAVNAQNDIVVADSNNHRVQIFDRGGKFRFKFGSCGRRDGQMLCPNRVAVVAATGDIIVTERSPIHQIQIYNQYGEFIRKFGANILQHPRGVTVDSMERIVVVECKVMRVIIFDILGNILHKFGCSKHLEFPNGIVVNDKEEIFISDNRAHCVKVFSYDGVFLRQIGTPGLTNYPIGVGINSAGEILIADNFNNFNITVFSQDGKLISGYESKVKHAECFDITVMSDGSVVLAAKDNRLYIYSYQPSPQLDL